MSDFENAGEYLMLRLRTVHGISEKEYYDIYRLKMDYVLELLQGYEKNGWAMFKDGRWRFTPSGFLLSNTLIFELLDAQTKQRTQISRPWQSLAGGEESQMTFFPKRSLEAGLFGRRGPAVKSERG